MGSIKTELKSSSEEREIPQEDNDGGYESSNFCGPDDSDEDPTFDLLEETRSRLSTASLKQSKPRARKAKQIDSESDGEEDGEEEPFAVEIAELNEKDGKCFEKVEEIIEDGHLERLKVEQCKVYLRKYGLRLTGNKGVLIERIKEHLGVINGGGEEKYPISSFLLNCKGDACTGDVVMFEQKVYEMFSIASRSAIGPPCGTRTVAGRIVKESYGAAKQQHTFTIEVLWSKGEKPLPPLHPLLIKGRNLYRLKTVRQRWNDEEERRRILQEKHSRGFVARCSRDTRINEKEIRKKGTIKRTGKEKIDYHSNPLQTKEQHVQNRNPNNEEISLGAANQMQTKVTGRQNIVHDATCDPSQAMPKSNQHLVNVVTKQKIQQQQQLVEQTQKHKLLKLEEYLQIVQQHHNTTTAQVPNDNYGFQPRSHATKQLTNNSFERSHLSVFYSHAYNQISQHDTQLKNGRKEDTVQSHYPECTFNCRQALSSSNHCFWGPQRRQQQQPRQWCRYYHQGRCYFGENCKYLHE